MYLHVCAYVLHVGDMTHPRLWLRGWGSERPAPPPLTVSHGGYTAGSDAQLCGYVLCDPQLVMHALRVPVFSPGKRESKSDCEKE